MPPKAKTPTKKKDVKQNAIIPATENAAKIIETHNVRFPDGALNLMPESPDYPLIQKFTKPQNGADDTAEYQAHLATLQRQQDLKLCGIRLSNVYPLSCFDDEKLKEHIKQEQEKGDLSKSSILKVKKELLDISIPENVLASIKALAKAQKSLA